MKGAVEGADRDPSVVPLEDAGGVFDALASETARRIVSALSDTPAPPSELAEAADTSVQNVHYHLDRLTEGGVVEVVDTWYSSRGVEMDVYALSSDPVVVCIGDPRGDGPSSGVPHNPDSDVTLAPSD
jgi:predicted transcriptional regulator